MGDLRHAGPGRAIESVLGVVLEHRGKTQSRVDQLGPRSGVEPGAESGEQFPVQLIHEVLEATPRPLAGKLPRQTVLDDFVARFCALEGGQERGFVMCEVGADIGLDDAPVLDSLDTLQVPLDAVEEPRHEASLAVDPCSVTMVAGAAVTLSSAAGPGSR
ncbi:hypothetical protein [Enhygromyxa salina]|uniref:hypothetical protein n=1 Tax=Enhygromyxa salina TaxID=215803 RepID=UPI0015E606DE|nr:hypothetical protein [Enhygromyxa salina]